jgi:hypothetical protein
MKKERSEVPIGVVIYVLEFAIKLCYDVCCVPLQSK